MLSRNFEQLGEITYYVKSKNTSCLFLCNIIQFVIQTLKSGLDRRRGQGSAASGFMKTPLASNNIPSVELAQIKLDLLLLQSAFCPTRLELGGRLHCRPRVIQLIQPLRGTGCDDHRSNTSFPLHRPTLLTLQPNTSLPEPQILVLTNPSQNGNKVEAIRHCASQKSNLKIQFSKFSNNSAFRFHLFI